MSRLAPNLIGRGQLASAQFAERLDGDIHVDFAAELEAVHDRPRCGKNVDADAFDDVCFDTAAESGVGQKDESQAERCRLRTPGGARHREPHFGGELRAQIVKVQRGEKAYDAVRNSLAGFGEAVVLRYVRVWEAVKTARVSDDEAACKQPREMLARSPGICYLHGTDEPPLANERKQPFGSRRRRF